MRSGLSPLLLAAGVVAVPNAPPPPGGSGCADALAKACSIRTDSVADCRTCTGQHQHELMVAGCSSQALEWWCPEAVVKTTTSRLAAAASALPDGPPPTPTAGAAGSGDDSPVAYREANLIADRGTTRVAYDPVRQRLFIGSKCNRRSSYSDCKPGTGVVHLWDIASQRVIANLSAHNASINALAYDSTRQLLFSASDEAAEGECCGQILVWNTAVSPPTVLHTLQSSHDPEYESCEPRANGASQVPISALAHSVSRQLLFASCGNTVQQWDITGMSEGAPPVQKHTMSTDPTEFDKKARITAMAFDDTNQWLFSNQLKADGYGSADAQRMISRWFTGRPTPENLHDLVGHVGGVNALAFDSESQTLFSGSDTNEVISWDVRRNATKAIVYSQFGKNCDDDEIDKNRCTSSVQFLAFDAAHHKLFSSDSRGTTVAWDTNESPPKATSSFACAVEAMPAPSISLRMHDVVVDSEQSWLMCSSACVDDYGSCPVQALTEVWHIPV